MTEVRNELISRWNEIDNNNNNNNNNNAHVTSVPPYYRYITNFLGNTI